jgi:hypothetical protein
MYDVGMKTDNEIISECGDDAAKWAKAFCETIGESHGHPAIAVDQELMIGWFANAIESRPRLSRLTASEAVFGFCGWLTSRVTPTVMSSKHNAATIADLVEEFCKANDLQAPRGDWSTRLTHPTTTREGMVHHSTPLSSFGQDLQDML